MTEGIEALWGKLDQWYTEIILILPNLILSIVIAVSAYYASRYIKKYLLKIISKFTSSRTISKTFANIGAAVFLAIIFFLILGVLNLDKALNTVLASAGVLGLAIGLALQEPLTNIFSGVMLSVRDKYNIGDLIETNGHKGVIKDVSLKATIIDLLTGESVSIPNKLILQNPIINYTTNGVRRVDVSCGVSYADDLNKVRKLAMQAIKDQVEHIEDKGIQIFYNEFGDSSINFSLRFWIPKTNQAQYFSAQSEAIIAIKTIFDKEGISIPFPIRSLDFGIKGTERLEDQFSKDNLAVLNHALDQG